jgi:hypothetical protein
MDDENQSSRPFGHWEVLKELMGKQPRNLTIVSTCLPNSLQDDVSVSIMSGVSSGIHPERQLTIFRGKQRPEGGNNMKLHYYEAIINNKPYVPGQEGKKDDEGN